jgi:hypothetical protein
MFIQVAYPQSGTAQTYDISAALTVSRLSRIQAPTYQIYGSSKNISTFQASSECSREKLACIMHGVPSTLSSNDMTSLVNDLRTVAGNIFVTGLFVDYYASFSPGWADFASEMAA